MSGRHELCPTPPLYHVAALCDIKKVRQQAQATMRTPDVHCIPRPTHASNCPIFRVTLDKLGKA